MSLTSNPDNGRREENSTVGHYHTMGLAHGLQCEHPLQADLNSPHLSRGQLWRECQVPQCTAFSTCAISPLRPPHIPVRFQITNLSMNAPNSWLYLVKAWVEEARGSSPAISPRHTEDAVVVWTETRWGSPWVCPPVGWLWRAPHSGTSQQDGKQGVRWGWAAVNRPLF